MTITQKQLVSETDSPNWNSLVGNLIAQEGAGGELISDGDYYREYNALHQLTRVRSKTATGKIVEEYSYGPDGERIMTVNYLTNTTIYTPFREWMMIVNRTGSYNYTYVYDGNVLVSKINPDGTKWFYHDDHLGSTSLITDENGNIVEETFYNPFGQVTSGGEREAYLLYTNQMKDAIGCYDYGARVYCPKWYHFTSADPITANVFDPQGLNRFAYVRNNPYLYIDPTGKRRSQTGAPSGYSKAGSAAASKAAYQAAHGGSSASSIYLVYSEQGTDGPVYITISTEGGFDELQEALKNYVESYQNVYGDYITTNSDQPIFNNPNTLPGFSLEAGEAIVALAENPYVQAVTLPFTAEVLGAAKIAQILGIGTAVTPVLQEMQTGEVEVSTVGWAALDSGMVFKGGPATKNILGKISEEAKASKVVNFLAGVFTSSGWEGFKSEVRGNEEESQEGGTNG